MSKSTIKTATDSLAAESETLERSVPDAKQDLQRETVSSVSEAPNPFDPKKLALQGNPAEAIGVKKALVHVPVRKPNRQEFFRTHHDTEFRAPMAILDLKDEGEIYLVTPEVAASLPGEVKPVMLTTCISRQGTVFLWPVPLPNEDGRQLAWHVSAREAAGRAENKWVRMVANIASAAYDVFEAPGEIAEPAWPDHTFQELLAVAFGNGKLIDRSDHPVLQQLLGQA